MKVGFTARVNGRSDLTAANVRFGSKADIEVTSRDVRFTPKSGHRNSVVECVRFVPKADILTRGSGAPNFVRRAGAKAPRKFGARF